LEVISQGNAGKNAPGKKNVRFDGIEPCGGGKAPINSLSLLTRRPASDAEFDLEKQLRNATQKHLTADARRSKKQDPTTIGTNADL
jgi:hypothetical protein